MLKIFLNSAFFIFIYFAATAYQQKDMLEINSSNPTPFFSLPVLDSAHNKRLSLYDLKGQKTVLYFFAPWCSICKYSMPNLNNLYTAGKINAVAIVLSYNDRQSVREFADSLDLNIPILLGDKSIATNFKITAFPTYYVVDEDLNIIDRSLGYSTQLGFWKAYN